MGEAMNRSEDRQCGNKKRHIDMYSAIKQIRDMILKDKALEHELHYYKCEYCGCYHVGHLSKQGQEIFRRNIKKRTFRIVRMK